MWVNYVICTLLFKNTSFYVLKTDFVHAFNSSIVFHYVNKGFIDQYCIEEFFIILCTINLVEVSIILEVSLDKIEFFKGIELLKEILSHSGCISTDFLKYCHTLPTFYPKDCFNLCSYKLFMNSFIKKKHILNDISCYYIFKIFGQSGDLEIIYF